MKLTEQQHEMIRAVVARFLNLQQPTPRRHLLRKYKDAVAIDQLLKWRFFSHVGTEFYAPLPLAFHHCGDASSLARARQATELALRVLQNLDEAHPEKDTPSFSREEFINHAGHICDPQPDQTELLLGLHLSTHFGIFTGWNGGSAPLHIPISFSLNEDIVTIDVSKAWDEYIKEREAFVSQAGNPSTGQNRSSEWSLDFANLQSSPNVRRAAVLPPPGQYDYHPEIKRVSERLCLEGNFRQAVLDAFIHVIATVKERTALPYDGDDLMNRAFSPDNRTPAVMFNPLRTSADKDEQRGIWNLFKGLVGLRNFKAHIVSEFDDPHRTHEYLALASLLMRLLDIAAKNSSTQQPPAAPAP